MVERFSGPALEIMAGAKTAASHIPPLWALDATVAVNPYVGQAGEPLQMAAARLARVAGVRTVAERSHFKAKFDAKELTLSDLEAGLAEVPELTITVDDLIAALSQDVAAPETLPTLADLAEDVSDINWPDFVAERIGHWAGGHYDVGQALWPAPKTRAWLSWRSFAQRDLTPEIFGLTGFASRVASMSMSARGALTKCAEDMGITAAASESYFHTLLMRLGGWGQLASGEAFRAALQNEGNNDITDLLTAKLVFEAALLARYKDKIGDRWKDVLEAHAQPIVPSQDDLIDAALQAAADHAAARMLDETLSQPVAETDQTPDIQAAFCIDVRSEIFRRALEATDKRIETIGFAGFFGIAAAHNSFASDVTETRGPVLINTGAETAASDPQDTDTLTRVARRVTRAWGRFRLAAVSSFAFVEATGPLYLGKLVRDSLAQKNPDLGTDPAPVLAGDVSLEDRIGMAAGILSAMSLKSGLAKLVLLAGHGARVVNNPHASALQCGACGGHAGDVNARLVALLLNDPEVRSGLVEKGLNVPADTLFVAGLHDTVTDEVTLYEGDLPKDHSQSEALAALKSALRQAAKVTRTERSARLPRADSTLAIMERAKNWSETRPEWGLAGCSAFIAAPRSRTAGRSLEGRSFLHNYTWQEDEGFGVLELILTAPVVVASWISLQYYGSSVAPDAFGAGNKLLHNVTGGIGVIEGNGGVLRGGLPWQSVHDGDRFMHDPVRLSVAVEAPREAITDILNRHPGVADLFDNGWLKLFAMDEEGRLAWRYSGKGQWTSLRGEVAAPGIAAE
ncbi:YbcC family protein [Marivita sp. S0852]|uniref:YbcC family protein n=1 Tax=Marivita sp. S0852 TaxID=3373893 RepID=UPI0039826D65